MRRDGSSPDSSSPVSGSHQYMRPPIALKRSSGGALGSSKMPVAPLHELASRLLLDEPLNSASFRTVRVQLYASSLTA